MPYALQGPYVKKAITLADDGLVLNDAALIRRRVRAQ
jgi:hypothetical protein